MKTWIALAALALAVSLQGVTPSAAQTPGQDACGAISTAEDGALSLVATPGYTLLTAIPPLAPP
ncbi:MAG TPA: hypothetical protein DHW63_01770, partial [Hyphomonadaceae bacterium]|nr:hypothetical protein [Hyphomonadaceae bacterium]